MKDYLFLVLLFFIVSCEQDAKVETYDMQTEQNSHEIINKKSNISCNLDLASSLNSYSFELYRGVKVDKENLFISPLSTYFALLVASEGSGGETKKEFKKTLYLNNVELLSSFNNFYNTLVTFIDSSNNLNISNAIWIKCDFQIENTYRKNVISKYMADIKPVDFSKRQEAASEINEWVSNKTKGLIESIINERDIDKLTRIIISNAIYFIGNWEAKFDKELTKPDNFYSISKVKSKVDFMHKTEYLKYFENDEIQFVSKPYKGNDKSFCIILPRKLYDIAEIEGKLNTTLLNTILNNSNHIEIELSIPKFKMETNYSLKTPLANMGLEKAFTQEADFSFITEEDNEPLWINGINHRAFIEINEEKTTAAAVTYTTMVGGVEDPKTQPKVFKADHPFIFMIIDNKTKGIIFIGRYVQPK